MTSSTLARALAPSRAERCAAREHPLYRLCGDGTDCIRYRERSENDRRPSEKDGYNPLVSGGYTVDVVVLRAERALNSADGNPSYRFHTDQGIYTAASDVQQSLSLTGEETGPAVLRIENARVVAWTFVEPGKC